MRPNALLPPLLLALGLALPPALQAAEDPALEALNSLTQQNRFPEAYARAQELLPEYEGDPDFDFLYGLAALETGRPNEAVFALERVAFNHPEQLRVKLELARAFFMINNLDASRNLFNEVLDSNPTENVRRNIQAYLDQIDARERAIAGSFNWYINTGIGSDSNINSATELGVISTPIGDVELNPGGKAIDDNFFDIGAGLNYIRPLTKTSAINFEAGYSLHNNLDSDDFDIGVLSGQASYAHLVNSLRLSYGLRGQIVELDGEEFQRSGSLIATLQRSPGNGWSQALTGAWTAVRFDDGVNANASLRDVDQWLVSGILGKATGAFNHAVSLYVGTEEPSGAGTRDNAQDFYGIAFSEQFQFRPGHTPYLRVSYHSSENKAPHVFFGKPREDDIFSTSLGWVWRANPNINITTDLTYTENDSNLELFSYDRLKFQTGLRYQF